MNASISRVAMTLGVLSTFACGGSIHDGEATPGDAAAGGSGGSGGAGGAAGSTGAGAAGTGGAVSECPVTQALPDGFTSCRDDSDCSPSGTCARWNESASRPCTPTASVDCPGYSVNCHADSDCTSGQICGETETTLSDPSWCEPKVCVASMDCQPACTSTSCSADEVCDPGNGRCWPLLCTAGFTCGPGFVCDLAGAADAHGCAPLQCAMDGYACPGGTHCATPEEGAARACGMTSAGEIVCSSSSADAHGCLPDLCPGGSCCPGDCAGGLPCPENHDCVDLFHLCGDPGGCTDPPHQCVRRSCTIDAECDCGRCVLGLCEEELFACTSSGDAGDSGDGGDAGRDGGDAGDGALALPEGG